VRASDELVVYKVSISVGFAGSPSVHVVLMVETALVIKPWWQCSCILLLASRYLQMDKSVISFFPFSLVSLIPDRSVFISSSLTRFLSLCGLFIYSIYQA
jgi:hypothetical protein